MLTTIDILNLLGNVPWFGGVFPIDRLPVTLGKDKAIVINLDESYKEGSHWVAIYLDKNKISHYFDSFGRRPQGPILTFIERISNFYLYNPNKYQGNLSVACGYFCLLFVISVHNLNNFYKLFRVCEHINNETKLLNELNKYLM